MCVIMTEIQIIEGGQKRGLLTKGDQIKKNSLFKKVFVELVKDLIDVDRLRRGSVEQVAQSVGQLRVQVVGHLHDVEIAVRVRGALPQQKVPVN